MESEKVKTLDMFFYPKTVAVIGASRDPKKTGNALIQNLLNYGYQGAIYPVNPTEDEILGVKAYRSTREIPGTVDLAIFTVPAPVVVKSMEEWGQKGVQAAVIHSSGFAEAGKEGIELQNQVVEIARKYGIRLVGPNCVGILCTESRLPWARRSTFPTEVGNVSVISQSGGGGGSFVNLAVNRGIHFNKVISIGNECDVSVIDFMEYFRTDAKTDILFIYLEGFKDGRRFVEVAKGLTSTKPIVVYKIGRTEVGQRAAASHTGSLAGSIRVYDGAFRQTGVLRAEGIDEALDYLVAFSNVYFMQGAPKGKRVGIVSGPGGPGVATADACVEAGLEVPDFSEETKNKIVAAIPTATRANPTETGDFGFVATMKERDPYGALVSIVEQDDHVDMVAIVGPGEFNPGAFRDVVLGVQSRCKKPFIVIWPSAGEDVEACKKSLETAKVPLFLTPERGAKALGALVRYQEMSRRLEEGKKP
jgi:acyl-CoA synthetase (NDP forming)